MICSSNPWLEPADQRSLTHWQGWLSTQHCLENGWVSPSPKATVTVLKVWIQDQQQQHHLSLLEIWIPQKPTVSGLLGWWKLGALSLEKFVHTLNSVDNFKTFQTFWNSSWGSLTTSIELSLISHIYPWVKRVLYATSAICLSGQKGLLSHIHPPKYYSSSRVQFKCSLFW